MHYSSELMESDQKHSQGTGAGWFSGTATANGPAMDWNGTRGGRNKDACPLRPECGLVLGGLCNSVPSLKYHF